MQYRLSQVQITRQNIQGSSSNNFYTLPPPLNRLQKGKYTPNTWLIHMQPLQIFYKINVLKLRKIQRKKLLLESLFNKVVGPKAWNLIKKRLQHRCFPVNFVLFVKKPYLQNTFGWLLLLIPLFQPRFYSLTTLFFIFCFIFFFLLLLIANMGVCSFLIINMGRKMNIFCSFYNNLSTN